jgi:hypothetical protein
MILLLIAVFICMIFYEVPKLVKNNYRKDLIVFSLLISLAFFISLMDILKVEIPNPAKSTQYFVKNLLQLSYD